MYQVSDVELLTLSETASRQRLTHYLFRYPAKFHPPVVAALLARYTEPGQYVLDPFVGSGTLLVEAALIRRKSVGVDIDPLAVSVALAKTRLYDLGATSSTAGRILSCIAPFERAPDAYQHLMRTDISADEMFEVAAAEKLNIPAIPNLQHWFRRYVVVDLARINQVIAQVSADSNTRLLFNVIFASIIRNSSNADPVPVSGLEYTSHMKSRDMAGRLINPFSLFRAAVTKALRAVQEWKEALPVGFSVEPSAFQGTALELPDQVPMKIDAVITSPPYHNAVDYYRRHQLEMFWLGHTNSQSERLALLPDYIGRPRVAQSNPLLMEPWLPSALADEWEQKIRCERPERAYDFRHYVQAMIRVFGQLGERIIPGGPAVFVLGQSSWNGEKIPTQELITELAQPNFRLQEVLSYPVKNRYMSYTRRNRANIDREYVLVLRRN
jgi:hypothetical protein